MINQRFLLNNNKQHKQDDLSQDSISDKTASARILNKRPSSKQSENEVQNQKQIASQEMQLNNYLLSQIRSKVPTTSKNDQSYNSKLSDKSKKSNNSGSSQVKKNSALSQNTKVSFNATQSKLSSQNVSINNNVQKNTLKSKLNSQMIQLFLSKKTPTNIQSRNEFKLNSDQQKKTELPQAQYSQPQVCKNDQNPKPKQDGLQNLLKIQMNILKKNNLQNNQLSQQNGSNHGISQFVIQNKEFQNQMTYKKTNINESTQISQKAYSSKPQQNKGFFKNQDKSTNSHFRASNMDVSESNDAFKCYEETLRLQLEDDDSLDHKSDFSLENKYTFLSNMFKKEQESLNVYFYIEFTKFQQQITPRMRGMLIDWMQQVSMEYKFKRETYHLSVCYLDTYLYRKQAYKETFQLLGLACIQIATKQEVILQFQEICPPSVYKLKECTGDYYSIEQINLMEVDILKVLQFRLNLITKNQWANFYLVQWDEYMSENLNFFRNKAPIFFKKPTEESYMVFREFYQIIEYTLIDLQSFEYPNRILVAASIFLVAGIFCIKGRWFKEFDTTQILQRLQNESLQLICMPYSFNLMIDNFLSKYFSLQLDDIIPAITFLSQFYEYQFCYEFPRAVKENKNQLIEVILSKSVSF